MTGTKERGIGRQRYHSDEGGAGQDLQSGRSRLLVAGDRLDQRLRIAHGRATLYIGLRSRIDAYIPLGSTIRKELKGTRRTISKLRTIRDMS